MKINETDDGIIFILSNQEIKKLRHTPQPMGVDVVKGDVKTRYSFISEKGWDNTLQKVVNDEKRLAKKVFDARKAQEHEASKEVTTVPDEVV